MLAGQRADARRSVGWRPTACSLRFTSLILGIRGEWVGPLLWPAVALHAVLTLLLARAWFSARSAVAKQPIGGDTHREKPTR